MKESQSGTQMWFSGDETPVRPETYSTRVHKCLQCNTLQDNKHITLQALLHQRGRKKKKKKTLITAVKLISNIVSPATELRMQRVMSKGLKHCRI